MSGAAATPLIAVYGATGSSGRLCVATLLARGLAVRLCGRDPARLARMAGELGGLPYRAAAPHDPGGLERALAGARVVVSCAGPFLQVGEPILAAALAVGAHYLDTSGEQAFVRRAYERFDAVARRAGVTAVPSTAFEVALGDWAAALAAAALPGGPDASAASPPERAPERMIDELVVAYALQGLRPTAGTASSALASLTTPGVFWDQDRWVEVAPAAHARSFAFPPPFGARDAVSFPSGEVVTVPRHLTVGRVETFVSLGSSPLQRATTRLASLAAPALPALLASPLGGLLLAQAAALRPSGPGGAPEARFAIVAEASAAFQRRRVTVSGGDPYRVTAHLIAHAAAALAAGEAPRAGVLAPAEAFPAARHLPAVAALADLAIGGDAAPGADAP